MDAAAAAARALDGVAALGVASLIVWRSFDGWQAMGFRTANFWRSLWIVAAALALAAAAMLVAARSALLLVPDGALAFCHLLRVRRLDRRAAVPVAGRLSVALSAPDSQARGMAALTASALFAVAHLPNPVLTPITFIWGCAACLLFLRYRNIYP
jgi:hypothetical protein